MRIIEILALMLGLAAVGVFLRVRGIAKPETAKTLNSIALNITLPAGIFLSLHHFNIGASALTAPALGAGLTLLLWRVSAWIAKRLGLPPEDKAVFILTVIFGNTAFVGFPVIRAVFGLEGLARATLVDQLGCEVLAFTLGVFIAGQGAVEARGVDWGAELRQLLRFPPLLALIAALLWHAFKLPEVPGAVRLILDGLSKTTVVFVMIALGLVLRPGTIHRSWRLGLLVSVLKLIVSPVLMLLACHAVGMDAFTRAVATIEWGMPTMMFTLVLVLRTGLDAELCAALITATLAGSLLTLPAWFAVLR